MLRKVNICFPGFIFTFASISSWCRHLAPVITFGARVWAPNECGTAGITSQDTVVLKSGNFGVSIFLKKKKKIKSCS